MGKSRRPTFCPHCGSIVPAGKRCGCRPAPPRKTRSKRKPTPGDKTRGAREPWRKHYSNADYRRNRQKAMARQKGRCADCGKVCAEYRGGEWSTANMDGEVDHVKPLCEGGTDDASNLELRCKSCHGKAEAKRREARKQWGDTFYKGYPISK